jgi:hypothetical protein
MKETAQHRIHCFFIFMIEYGLFRLFFSRQVAKLRRTLRRFLFFLLCGLSGSARDIYAFAVPLRLFQLGDLA